VRRCTQLRQLENLLSGPGKIMQKFAIWVVAALFVGTFSCPAQAECSTTIQCIGISANSPAEAEHNHHGGVAGAPGTTPGSVLVTMDFSNRPVASSTVKTLYVAAAQGPTDTVVQLNPIRVTGADANQFSLVGGTCALNGGNGPTHGANETGYCTIEVRFNPTSPGVKTALLTVPFPQPVAGLIDHRDATLAGIGGDERISPAADSQVASLIASQVASLHKFGAAQTANISNRLASLHSAQSAQGTQNAPGGHAPHGAYRSREMITTPPATSPGAGSQTASTVDQGLLPGLLTALLTSRAVPLMLASDRDAEPGSSDGGYWLSGMATFGRLGAASDETRFETSGLTAGADMRLGRDFIAGAAAGYSRSSATFGPSNSDSRNTGQSVSLYGSYQALPDVYVDALLGYGTMESRSTRYVSANGALAMSERSGSQIFGSLAVSHELHEENLSWAPYARLDFSSGKLDRADETGAGISSLTYFDQNTRSSNMALGIRTRATHESEFGLVIPQLRLEYRRELQNAGSATIAYADQPGGPTYTVSPFSEGRSSLLLGMGTEILLNNGIVFGFEVASSGRLGSNAQYATRFWLSTALDDNRHPPQGIVQTSSSTPVSVIAALRVDNNVSRTGTPTTPLSDRTWVFSAGMDRTVDFSDSLSLRLGAMATNEKFVTYDGLDSATLTGRAELAYQAGGSFAAPRFGLFASAAYDDSRSELRTGSRFEAGLNARLQIAEQSGLSGVLAHNRRRAKGEVFDTDFNSAQIGLDHQAGDRGNLRFTVEARRGDFVSSGTPMADSAAISEVLVADDAYPTQRFVAYRFPAKSLIATLGYTLAVGSRDSIDLSWTSLRVTPTKTPDYTWFPPYPGMGLAGAGGDSAYSVRQLNIAYTMLF
jgi:outer membrane autotransporter protein